MYPVASRTGPIDRGNSLIGKNRQKRASDKQNICKKTKGFKYSFSKEEYCFWDFL